MSCRVAEDIACIHIGKSVFWDGEGKDCIFEFGLIGDRLDDNWCIINWVDGNAESGVSDRASCTIGNGKAKTIASRFTTIVGIGQQVTVDVCLGEKPGGEGATVVGDVDGVFS